TGFRSATAEPLAGRTGTKQTNGTTPHTGGALGNLNLIGKRSGQKLALSAPAPGYKEVEVQVKEVPIWQKSNLTLEEAAAYSGIGINKLRSMTDSDECKFVL
ncbi:Electron transfer flavoprotein alpha/beta-subunit N-terminal domain-containing protein, partial [Dysosmobacter welbionis]